MVYNKIIRVSPKIETKTEEKSEVAETMSRLLKRLLKKDNLTKIKIKITKNLLVNF